MFRSRSVSPRSRSPGFIVLTVLLFSLLPFLRADAGQNELSYVRDPELVRIYTEYVTKELANKEKYYPKRIVLFMDGLARKDYALLSHMIDPRSPLKSSGIDTFIFQIYPFLQNIDLIDYRIIDNFKNVFLIRVQAVKVNKLWFEEIVNPLQFDLVLQVLSGGIYLRLEDRLIMSGR